MKRMMINMVSSMYCKTVELLQKVKLLPTYIQREYTDGSSPNYWELVDHKGKVKAAIPYRTYNMLLKTAVSPTVFIDIISTLKEARILTALPSWYTTYLTRKLRNARLQRGM